MINWNDPECKITEHFTVEEAITLHSWNRLATETDGLDDICRDKIVDLCNKMETVREILDSSINVHCMFRSSDYNASVLHILPHDVHSLGMAIDFDCSPKLTVEEIKNVLESRLEELGLRMEFGTTTWVHLDTRPPGPSGRYFNP